MFGNLFCDYENKNTHDSGPTPIFTQSKMIQDIKQKGLKYPSFAAVSKFHVTI